MKKIEEDERFNNTLYMALVRLQNAFKDVGGSARYFCEYLEKNIVKNERK